jgi:neutral ceramidase
MLIPLLISCQTETERTPQYLEAGPPMAGVAEIQVDFPVGSPMGGYSSRCGYLGGSGRVDQRQSAYTVAFTPSSGVQTPSLAKVLWLENGSQDFVMVKADIIYSYDNLVKALEERLEEETGRDLKGKVVITASHTHHAPANYSDQIHFYLGGDRYNEEIFQRFLESLVQASMEAFESREEASIGFSLAMDWDPDDQVYADRRTENDDLAVWDDVEPGYGKDPRLWMLRIDSSAGVPMGVFFNFGIHGTLLGGDNAMISTDASGHIEYIFQDKFDAPVVVGHFQGSGGDATPTGSGAHGHEYAVLEGIGEYAADALYELWESTETSTSAFTMEMVTQSAQQGLEETRVERNGTVDWHYQPYDPDYVPDEIIYGDDGEILSPLDEFNAEFGAAFCGYNEPMISTGTIGVEVYPYNGCTKTDLISYVINGIFHLSDFLETGEAPLPLPSSMQASLSTLRMGPMALQSPDGSQSTEDIFFGFFPGETTGMFLEQFRRRAESELGFKNTIGVGYSQDHEGYLLIPEDWLLGGYEPNINIWGPLQGEHIMEHGLKMSESHLLTDLIEPQDPLGEAPRTSYQKHELPTLAPDLTPGAGTAMEEIPEELYTPLGAELQVEPDVQVQRINGMAQFIWEGGDPGVDHPMVFLEMEVDGEWVEVTTPSGRAVSNELPDILLTHTPAPLYPHYDPQAHYWWAGWQTIGEHESRMGLPLGNYRFHIYGSSYTGQNEQWPWDTESYDLTSPAFEIIPAEIALTIGESTVEANIMGPDWGYRLIDIEGSSQGANPPLGRVLSWELDNGEVLEEPAMPSVQGGSLVYDIAPPEGAVALAAEDAYGNNGRVSLPEDQ